jgi:beta-lactamase class A
MNVSITLKRTASLTALPVFTLFPIAGCSTTDDSSAASQTTPAPVASAEPTATASAATEADLDAEPEPDLETAAMLAAERFEQLEDTFDARLGVYAVDTGTEQTVTYRADERFAFASTFKAFVAAAILRQSSLDELDNFITYSSQDLVAHSPVTEEHVDTGMTLRELSEAAVRFSDNTATNLLLLELGGPSGLGAELSSIGDDVSIVDLFETEMSEAAPDDDRDTSTPRAFGYNLREYVLEDALPAEQRQLLTEWLIGNVTGEALIRAGAPDDWTIGDRTGAGGYGTRNAIAVLWPPEAEPIVLAVMSTRDTKDAEYDDALVAEATTVALDALARPAAD